jgi:hypothetical protein
MRPVAGQELAEAMFMAVYSMDRKEPARLQAV